MEIAANLVDFAHAIVRLTTEATTGKTALGDGLSR